MKGVVFHWVLNNFVILSTQLITKKQFQVNNKCQTLKYKHYKIITSMSSHDVHKILFT